MDRERNMGKKRRKRERERGVRDDGVVDNTGRDKRRNTGRIRKGMRGRESCGNWKSGGLREIDKKRQ